MKRMINNETFTRVSYMISGAYEIKTVRNNNVRNIFNAKYNQITVHVHVVHCTHIHVHAFDVHMLESISCVLYCRSNFPSSLLSFFLPLHLFSAPLPPLPPSRAPPAASRPHGPAAAAARTHAAPPRRKRPTQSPGSILARSSWRCCRPATVRGHPDR